MHEYAVKSAVTFVVTRPKILLKIGCKSLFTMGGGETQNRTGDTRIFSPLLYRLSYFAVPMDKPRNLLIKGFDLGQSQRIMIFENSPLFEGVRDNQPGVYQAKRGIWNRFFCLNTRRKGGRPPVHSVVKLGQQFEQTQGVPRLDQYSISPRFLPAQKVRAGFGRYSSKSHSPPR
mgnify:FL=1